ncbi:MAG: gluconokinase [Thermomicrobiales bacterium]
MPTIPLADAQTPLVLAIDLGTSSFRALLYDAAARAVAHSDVQIGYDLRTTPDGGAEVDADALLALLVRCVDGVLLGRQDRVGEIAAVGVSCFWHSLLGLDDAGRPVTPVYYWGDRRSGPRVAALRAELDEAAIHQRTGCVLHSSYWPAKLRWLRETDPERFGRVARWCSFADCATRVFHGEDLTSVAMASGTGMFDVRRVAWDEEMARAVGVDPATLPRIASRAEGCVGLREPFAGRWPALARIPWYPGFGDGACANVGCGAVTPARIALTIGTSAAMRIVVPHAPGEPLTIPPDLWAYRLDDRYVVLGGALSNGGNVIEWLWRLTGVEPTGEAMSAAADLPPDAHGLTILPFLSGERSPIWSDAATGVVAGLTLHTGPADLPRAGMEAVAYRLAHLYDSLKPLVAADHEIAANGGAILGSRSWMRIVADTLERPIRPLPADEEASARGVAILALESAGIIPSLDAVPDPAAGCAPIPAEPRHAAAYRAGRRRQTHLESLLLPAGLAWTDALD